MNARRWIGRLANLLLAFAPLVAFACGSSSPSSGSACFAAGERRCPNDSPYTQSDADNCQRCSAQYRAMLACDPNGGVTCLDGKSETSKDLTCKSQIDAFETCFTH
jgi:hypothetical protein